jgi:microcystin-dependent protein
MATPFLAEIDIFAFNFAPKGWSQCNGQLLPINQNQALFSLLGTTFGGDGRTTFGLPDLRSRVPISFGGDFTLGERGGEENHTIIQSEMPTHNHSLMGNSAAGTTDIPATNTVVAKGAGVAAPGGAFTISPYSTGNPNNAQYAGSITLSGGSQPHNNLMPLLVLNMCIALQGIFPSQN